MRALRTCTRGVNRPMRMLARTPDGARNVWRNTAIVEACAEMKPARSQRHFGVRLQASGTRGKQSHRRAENSDTWENRFVSRVYRAGKARWDEILVWGN